MTAILDTDDRGQKERFELSKHVELHFRIHSSHDSFYTALRTFQKVWVSYQMR